MINVVSVIKTCESVPAQWEGRTDDDCAIYVRYRHGWLEISVSRPGGTVDDAIGAQLGEATGETVLSAKMGDDYDGHMSAETLMMRTAGIVSWPQDFELITL